MTESQVTRQPERDGGKPSQLHYLNGPRMVAILGMWAYHAARSFMLQDWPINDVERWTAIGLSRFSGDWFARCR